MHNGNSIKLIGMCFALMCQNGATPGETKAIYLFQRVYISHLGIPVVSLIGLAHFLEVQGQGQTDSS